MPRGSPVSVYLFPGEASKRSPSVLMGDDSELDGLVATATEAQADMMSEEGSEGSTDNDDFCILEAPGMGIPVSLYLLYGPVLSLINVFFAQFPELICMLTHKMSTPGICCSPRTGSPW